MDGFSPHSLALDATADGVRTGRTNRSNIADLVGVHILMDQSAIVTFHPSIGGRIIRILTAICFSVMIFFLGSKTLALTLKYYLAHANFSGFFHQDFMVDYLLLFLFLAIATDSIRVLYSKIELNSEGIYYIAPLKRRFIPYSDIKNVYRTYVSRGDLYTCLTQTQRWTNVSP